MDLDTRLSKLNIGVAFEDRKINSILFADDLLLVASSKDDMAELLRVFQSWFIDYRMEVSE